MKRLGAYLAALTVAGAAWAQPTSTHLFKEQIDTSGELATILGDETGSGLVCFATSPTLTTPLVSGKIDANAGAVNDDDCTGEQGLFWYDSTDLAFEFCNANSGAPSELGGAGGATALNDIGDATAAGSVEAAEWAQDWNFTSGATTAAALDGLTLTWTYPSGVTTDSGTQRLLRLNFLDNAGDATGRIESMLSIDNQDANDAPAYGLRIDATQPWGTGGLFVTKDNGILITGAAAASGPTIASTGTDIDVDLNLNTKGVVGAIRLQIDGTTKFQVSGNEFRASEVGGARLNDSASSLTSATLVPYRTDGDTGVGGNGSNIGALIAAGDTALTFTAGGSDVNYVKVSGAATGIGPTIASAGSDTNIDLNLDAKGTGGMNYGSADVTDHTFTTDGTGTAEVVMPAGSVDSTEVLDGTLDALDANTDLRSDSCFQFIVGDIAATDEWEIELPNWPGTMTDFRCEAQGGTSFTVNVCDGEDLGDDTCTTSILGATLTCTTGGANDNTLSSATFVANDSVSIVVTAVSGTVSWARMKMNCQRD